MAAPEDLGSDAHVLDPSVGARSQVGLVDPDVRFLHGASVGIGHEGLELREVVLERPAVDRVVVRIHCLVFSADAVLDVLAGQLVAREDTGLAAGPDGHVGDGEPVRNADVLDIAVELEGLVVGPVDADVGDDLQDEVLAPDVPVELPLDDALDGLRDLEPEPAGGEDRRGLGGSDSGGQRVDRSVRAGVRVGSDYEPAGSREALLDHQLVAYAAPADLEIVRYLVLLRELAHLLGLGRGVYVLGRDVVVRDEDHPVLVQPVGPELLVLPEGDGARDVVDHHVVHIGYDYLPGAGVRAGFPGEDLLRDRLACHFLH